MCMLCRPLMYSTLRLDPYPPRERFLALRPTVSEFSPAPSSAVVYCWARSQLTRPRTRGARRLKALIGRAESLLLLLCSAAALKLNVQIPMLCMGPFIEVSWVSIAVGFREESPILSLQALRALGRGTGVASFCVGATFFPTPQPPPASFLSL